MKKRYADTAKKPKYFLFEDFIVKKMRIFI